MSLEKRTYTVVGIFYSNGQVVSHGTFYVAALSKVDAVGKIQHELPEIIPIAIFAGKQDEILYAGRAEWVRSMMKDDPNTP